jgi:hypothetical protein
MIWTDNDEVRKPEDVARREQAIWERGYRLGYKTGYKAAGGRWVGSVEIEPEHVTPEAFDIDVGEMSAEEKIEVLQERVKKLGIELTFTRRYLGQVMAELKTATKLIGKGVRQALAADALAGDVDMAIEERVDRVRAFFARKGVMIDEQGPGDDLAEDEQDAKALSPITIEVLRT